MFIYGGVMYTEVIDFYKNEDGFKRCVEAIKNNRIVVFPTETVYGIGANALKKEAVLKIFDVKGRARDNPLIVHICEYDIEKYATNISDDVFRLIENFWPGPLTLILKKKNIVPDETTGGKDTVALRMPNNEIALELIKQSGCPIAAPSANISGRPSGTNAKRCFQDLNGRVEFIINGFESEIGLESTVISMVDNNPIILRTGYISFEKIKQVIPNVKLYTKINEKILLSEDVISPGLKYKHYAPKCDMVIINSSKEKILNYLERINLIYKKIGILCVSEHFEFYKRGNVEVNVVSIGKKDDFKEIGKNLFESIRKFDDFNCDFIVSECFFQDFSNAVMNRLLRASSYNVITL